MNFANKMAAVHTFRITFTFCVGDTYMVFDISFRSGVMNGIVFFDQVIESFKVGWYGHTILI